MLRLASRKSAEDPGDPVILKKDDYFLWEPLDGTIKIFTADSETVLWGEKDNKFFFPLQSEEQFRIFCQALVFAQPSRLHIAKAAKHPHGWTCTVGEDVP